MFFGTRLPIVISLAAAAASPSISPPRLRRRRKKSHGKELFTRYCGACHGPPGPATGSSSPDR